MDFDTPHCRVSLDCRFGPSVGFRRQHCYTVTAIWLRDGEQVSWHFHTYQDALELFLYWNARKSADIIELSE